VLHQFGVIVAKRGHGNTGDVGSCIVMSTREVWADALSCQHGRCGKLYCHDNAGDVDRCIVMATWEVRGGAL